MAAPPDFSLILGGPLYQLYRRMHLSDDGLQLLRRRVALITALVWLPLVVLSALEGHALAGSIAIPFLYDIEANVRLLISLPALIIAEVVVHVMLAGPLRRFVERDLIAPEDMPRLKAAIASAARTRNSVVLELALLIFAYTVGAWLWRSQIVPGRDTWYALSEGTGWRLTAAGYWNAFVSVPLVQFILLRWYLRFVIWFRLLWQISRLNLRLSAAHPDKVGGIAFLANTSYAFGPILFAQGAMLAGAFANRILLGGQSLVSFKMEAAGFVTFFVVVILGPLLMFTPLLARSKRSGLAEYGLLASRYVSGFETKWMRGVPETNKLLGAPDLQSLADLGNSFAVVQHMRTVVFEPKDVVLLAAMTAAPLLPLGLTMFSLQDLLMKVIKIVL